MNKQEWDNSLLEHFALKKGGFSLDLLMEMVEEVMDSGVNLLSEGKGTELGEETKKSIMDLLPKFEISEDWGQKDTDARREFEKYMNNIVGTSIPDKLAYIREFTNGHDPSKYQVHEILSNLMFLDLLSTVVNNFSPSGSGFLFEAFMAGLVKGTQSVEKVEGVLQIDDFLNAEGVPFSLKLLVPGTEVKGSIRNLIWFLAHHDEGHKGIEYLTVYKYGKDPVKVLSFYSFTITYKNIYYWIANSLIGFNKALKLAEGAERRVGPEAEETIEQYKAEQERVLKLVKASYGGQKGYAKQLEMMTSEEGIEGANLLKQYGKEQNVLPVEDEQWLDLSAEEILNLGGFEASPEATAEENERQKKQAMAWLKKLSNWRKELHKKIKAYADPSHPMGSVLKTVEFAPGGEEAAASIEELVALYEQDKNAWEVQMLKLAGLAVKKKAAKEKTRPPDRRNIMMAEGSGDGTQFEIKSSLITTKTLPAVYQKVRYGEIVTNEDEIKKIGDQYAKQLEGSVMLILEQLDALISGITGYFVGDAKDRGAAGTSAIDSSKELSRIFSEKQQEK
jgi:hypothetical protein